MVDENNLPVGHSDYQYKEEQAGDYAAPPSMDAMNAQIIKSRLKRMFIPIGLMIVVYIVYHVLSWYAGRKPPIEEPKAVAQTVVQPVVPAAPTITVAKIEAIVRNDLNELAQQLQSNRQQVAALANALTESQNDITQLKQAITELTHVVTRVSEQTYRLTHPKPKPKPKPKKAVAIYRAVAIVPGRAWLRTADGKSLTVREGETLAGYGKIEVISPQQGKVMTSSGAVIQYGSNDA